MHDYRLGVEASQIGAGSGAFSEGLVSYEDWNTFAKAVQTSSYEVDHANLSGVAALRPESLESVMRAVVGSQESLTLLRDLKRTATQSSVDEWMVQTSLGGQVDGMFNSETGDINSDVGEYEREILFMKYLMTQVQISHVASTQKLKSTQLRAQENNNAVLRLSIALNRALYHGDSRYAPLQFDGIRATLERDEELAATNIVNLRGTSDINEVVERMFMFKAVVQEQGNFGDITHIYSDTFVQNDLDMHLFEKYRVSLNDNPRNLELGAPVGKIRTSMGEITMRQDIWIDNNFNSKPAFAKNPKLPDDYPDTPTIVVTKRAKTGNEVGFTAAQAGTYWVSVAPRDAKGVEGIPTTPVSVTVAAGEVITIQVTPALNGKAYAFAEYRSTQDPTTAVNFHAMRLVRKFAAKKTNNRTDPFTAVDDNSEIPGTSTLHLLNKTPASIQYKQLLPVTQFPLAATNSAVYKWAVLMYGALQLGIKRHHFVLPGYLPQGALWKPHKVA
ncbi:phage capsid protein [Deinococcus sp. PEB2-67]